MRRSAISPVPWPDRCRIEACEPRRLLASISGTVYHDIDVDATRDVSEPPLGDWVVYIDANNNCTADSNERQTTSDAGGNYTLSAVPVGAYLVRAAAPAEIPPWARTQPSSGAYTVGIVFPTQSVTGRDFGYTKNGAIRGQVFHDADGDRVKDAGEAGIAGRTVYLDENNSNTLDSGDISTTTDASGNYRFAVPGWGSSSFNGFAATYSVRQVVPASWVHTFPSAASSYRVALHAGEVLGGYDFGSFNPAEISGVVFHDLDGDGTQGDGEGGLWGRTIYLDGNDNGTLDTFAPTALASADVSKPVPPPSGFPVPQPGVAESSLIVNGLSGTLLDVEVTLSVSQSDELSSFSAFLVNPAGLSVYLGYASGDADFSDTTFDDEATATLDDGVAPYSGRFQPAEPLSEFDGGPLTGTWMLRLTRSNAFGSVDLDAWSLTLTTGEARTTTGDSGRYRFDHLVTGNYTLRQLPVVGFAQTAPRSGFHSVSLATGQRTFGRDFGNRDIVAPINIDRLFEYQSRQSVDLRFSEAVQLSLSPEDLLLENLSTGTTVFPADIQLTYDALGNTASFSFPGYPNGILPDGNYRATLAASSVTDAASNPLAADVSLDFFVLAADANRDRKVDFGDFLILRSNFGRTGDPLFSEADFNYDGKCDFGDFLILRSKFGVNLPPPSSGSLFAGEDDEDDGAGTASAQGVLR